MTHAVETRQASHDPSTIVRWEFARGAQRVSCQIDRIGRAFQVAVVPYRDLRQASIETFQHAAEALGRHASLATSLRTSGWKLVSYTN